MNWSGLTLLSSATSAILPPVIARGGGLITRDIGAEAVIYDPSTHRAHCLGRIAAAVWRQCDGRSGLAGIAGRASHSLGEPLDEESVRLTLSRLEEAGLVQGFSHFRAAHPTQEAVGRRAALRSVGAAAGLTVLSLAVPSPAQVAATCRPTGDRCARSSECCSSCSNPHSGRCSNGRNNCAVP
jgi:hypothetical protein